MQIPTHLALAQKQAGLAALRARTHLEITVFYTIAGIPAPAPLPRYFATAKGNMWHVLDRATGKTCAFRTTYEKAMQVLDGLEAGAASKRGWQ